MSPMSKHQINMPHYCFLAERRELFVFSGASTARRQCSVGARGDNQGERCMAEWLEIIDIPTKRLQMASWQMESLSGKKNGSSGASTAFSISASLAGGDLLSLKAFPSSMINYLTPFVYLTCGKGILNVIRGRNGMHSCKNYLVVGV